MIIISRIIIPGELKIKILSGRPRSVAPQSLIGAAVGWSEY